MAFMDDQPQPVPHDAEEVEVAFTQRELEMIAEAEASVAQDGTIPGDEVHAWLDSLFTPNPLPAPEPRKRA